MPDHSDLSRDDGRIWGHIEAGVWRPLAKAPLLDGGYGPAPFDIEIRPGVVRRVVHRPEDAHDQ